MGDLLLQADTDVADLGYMFTKVMACRKRLFLCLVVLACSVFCSAHQRGELGIKGAGSRGSRGPLAPSLYAPSHFMLRITHSGASVGDS